jgi:kynurenine formamidase
MTAGEGVPTTLLGRKVRLYDLSQEVSQNTQVHPLHPHVAAITHFDPAPDAATIDQMPLDLFCDDAICLDFSHLPPLSGITVADIETALARDGLDLRRGATRSRCTWSAGSSA